MDIDYYLKTINESVEELTRKVNILLQENEELQIENKALRELCMESMYALLENNNGNK